MLGILNTSLFTLALRGFKSTQIRIAPDFLGTTTIPAHHSVGSDILRITPICSMRSSSSLTLERNAIGILRALYKALKHEGRHYL